MPLTCLHLPIDSVALWQPLAAECRRDMPGWVARTLAGPLAAGDAEVVATCRDQALGLLAAIRDGLTSRTGRQVCLYLGLALIVGESPGGEAYRHAMVAEMGRKEG